MAENKDKKVGAMFLPELGCMALMALGIWGMKFTGLVKQENSDMLSHIVFAVLGIAALGFQLRRELLEGTLDYDNGEHPGRFWTSFLLGIAVSLVCIFLPEAAWPFLPVYVLLELFGSPILGTLGATLLLAISVSCAGVRIEVFLMYLISSFFGAALFRRLQNGFKAGLPVMLSMAGLFVCETAGTVLVANARPGLESFVLPAANLLVSGILLLGILKFFSEKVLYRYRGNYLDLNDPENEILAALKQKDRRAYMKSVHTAYFCGRIAAKLGLNPEPLKCAGYYHGMGESLAGLMESHSFPPDAVSILEEYQDRSRPVRRRETAVLMASESIINAILLVLDKAEGDNVDYDKVIDAVFDRYQEMGTFRQCEISMRELHTMQKIFKEEKLYYGFLR